MSTVSINTQFPGYEILGELGRGNARVLKARHVATGDLVAIKQFALDTDAETLHRFQQESDIMTRIDHPNVVKVREIALEAAMPYLVMEYVEGGDLRSLLKQHGYLPLTMTLRLGLQMAEALRVIHQANVIHRDIKPENILYRRLVSGELHFLLTDFGIAKIRADESTRTRTGHSLLTYEYAAPEQFDDPRYVGLPADYYALGAVLYEAVTGRVPFALADEAGLAAFMRQVLTATPPEPAMLTGQPLPPSLHGLLRNLLVKRPDERLCDIDEVELLLEQAKVELLRANRPGVAAPVTTTVPFRPANVTLPAPVLANEAVDYSDEPVEELNAAGQSWWAIVLALLVTAGVLAFVWKTRSNQATPSQKPVADSVATAPVDTASSQPEDSTATVGQDESPEMNADSAANQTSSVTDESTEPAADPTPIERPPAATPDSARTLPDSTP